MERAPAVAGLFYPGDAASLRRSVDDCLGAPPAVTRPAVAIVVPHAGYVYSGRTAGKVYARTSVPDRVLLLGPNHTGLGRPAAVWARGTWRTPLGPVPVDEELAAAVLKAHAALEVDTAAHVGEHSLEVQLPFLLRRNPGVRVVPLCLSDTGLPVLLDLGRELARVLQARSGDWLIVVSSDMTHYESRQAAAGKDRLAIERMEAVDAAGLYRTVREQGISMCGVVPATVGLAAAAALGASRAALVDYSCSGDVSGDDRDVVAYAGMTVA